MSESSFITGVVAVLGRALKPFSRAVAAPEELALLLAESGWHMPAESAVPPALVTVADAIDSLLATIADQADAGFIVEQVIALIRSIGALRNSSIDVTLGAPFDNPVFWQSLPEDLLALLLSNGLEREKPGVYGILFLAGVVRKIPVEANDVSDRGAYLSHVIDWSALAQLVTGPADHIRSQFRWNNLNQPFDHVAWLNAMHAVAGALGASATFQSVTLEELQPFVSADNPERPRMRRLVIAAPSVMSNSLDSFVKSALSIIALPPQQSPDAEPEGVLIAPVITGAAQTEIRLNDDAVLRINGDLQSSPVRFGIRPSGITQESAETNVSVDARVDIEPRNPITLIGAPTGSRFELEGAHLIASLSLTESASQLEVDLVLDNGSVVLDLGSADAFVSETIGGGQYRLPVSLDVTWSEANGLRIAGAELPSIRLPVNLTIGGVFNIDRFDIALAALDTGATELALKTTGALDLGPFAFVFENLGVGLAALPMSLDDPGNFGALDVSLGFKPPTGMGLSIDVGVVSGGGFIGHEIEFSRYTGAAEFSVFSTGIAAVGVLLSRLPEAPDTWSMFLSLAARFTGVQLGFGFTLNGVGGLVGINRGLDDDALGDAVRSGSLDDILFPEDPVADAARILVDIDAIFPPVLNQYVFGPVVRIGWGTPTLIELDLGVAIQLPEPLTVSLLGALVAVLPDEDAPVLELNAAFAGTVNVTEGTLKIDASLTGSKVAGLLITGDLSVRMEFFGEPNFLVAFGGFHPAFDPPASFPRLSRLGITLDTGDILQISLGGYFALSSNSIQFGAFAQLYISELGFTAEGGVEFDALIIFRPFSFHIGLSVWVSISAGNAELLSVLLEGNLRGPNPWQVAAEASFKVLGIKQSIDFDFSIGDRENQAAIEEINVQSLLIEALQLDDAWSVLPPLTHVPVVTHTDDEVPALDPAGRIQVSQRIVPLDQDVERYGNAELADASRFSIAIADFNPDELTDIDEYYGAEHYFHLDQDERLSAPSFNAMKAGLIIGSDRSVAPATRTITYDLEVAYRDAQADMTTPTLVNAERHTIDRALASRAGGSVQQAFTVSEPNYVLTNASTGAVQNAVNGRYRDYFVARQALATAGDDTRLVPAYEMELEP